MSRRNLIIVLFSLASFLGSYQGASALTCSGPFSYDPWTGGGRNNYANGCISQPNGCGNCWCPEEPAPAPTPINGACGSANGGSYFNAPSSNLCSSGDTSSVSGSGPWSWTCSGSNGGSNASCAANLKPTPINGSCGSADGKSYSSRPSSNLCSSGDTSSVSGSGPWSWTCSGSNGGSSASCAANLKPTPINASCGSGDTTFAATVTSWPTGTTICSSGTASPANPAFPAEGGSVSWTCNGADGGANTNCQASRGVTPPVNADCGTRNKTYSGEDTAWPSDTTFCATGDSSPANPTFPAEGESVSWTCSGLHSGANATCQATRGTIEKPVVVEEDDDKKEEVNCRGTIGDYVWLDTNSDGVQDAGEKGLSNITLKLKNSSGKEIDKTHTNSKGKYEFNDLCEGSYSVYVSDGDVSSYVQTFDQDGNKNNKTDVRLKGNHDDYKKADFGYNKVRTVPVTGSGNAAIYLSGLLPLAGLWIYRKKLGLKLNRRLF